MAMTQSELTKSLNKVKIQLMSKPDSIFLSTVLFSLKISWDDTINPPTVCVDGLTISIHPEFWESLSLNHRVFLLAHEAWHVAFQHLIVPTHINREKHNAAADYVINIMLKDSKYDVPNFVLCDKKYRGMSTMQVYKTLPDAEDVSNKLCDDIKSPATDTKKSEVEDLKNKIDNIIVKAATATKLAGKKIGNLPGEVGILLDKLTNPQLNWRIILQNYLNTFDKTDFSFRKPNRRFMPTYYLPSLYGESINSIGIAADTSGSVYDFEFNQYISEVNQIKKIFNPKLTTFVDFDTSIKHVHKINRNTLITNLPFSGRGGTNLECVFEYFNEHPPKFLIIFSDLECRQITEKPKYPVIWVCVNNTRAKVNFGKLIHITTKE